MRFCSSQNNTTPKPTPEKPSVKTVPIKFFKPRAARPQPADPLEGVIESLNQKKYDAALSQFSQIKQRKEITLDYALCLRLLQAIVQLPKYHALAIELLRNMHTLWKHPPAIVEFHLALEALARANRPTLQQTVLERLLRMGFTPNAETYSLLLLAFSRPGERLPRAHPFYYYLQEAIRLAKSHEEHILVLERAMAVALASSQTSAAEEVALWITHAGLMAPAHGILQTLLENVGYSLQLKPVLTIYDRIRTPLSEVAALALFRLQAATDPAGLTALYESMRLPLSPDGCAELISLAGSASLAEALEKLLKEEGEEYTVEIYNALTRVYGSHNMHDRVDALLNEMQQKSVVPDRGTLQAAVSSAPSIEKARQRLEEITSHFPQQIRNSSTAIAALAMLELCYKLKDPLTAAAVWGDIQKPTKQHYVMFLSVLSQSGDYGMMRQCYRTAKETSYELFDAMIRHCESVEDMKWCLREISQARISFTELKHIDQMLRVLANAGLLDPVQQIISHLTENGRTRPSLAHYEELIRAAMKCGSVPAAKQYLLDAVTAAIQPQADQFNILLRSCLFVGDRHRFQKVLEEMEWQQVTGNDETKRLVAQMRQAHPNPAAAAAAAAMKTSGVHS